MYLFVGVYLSYVNACDLFSFGVFLWRSHKKRHKNMNNVLRLVNPVYDRNMYVFKVNNVITKQAESE